MFDVTNYPRDDGEPVIDKCVCNITWWEMEDPWHVIPSWCPLGYKNTEAE
jgi:hypothetical protein